MMKFCEFQRLLKFIENLESVLKSNTTEHFGEKKTIYKRMSDLDKLKIKLEITRIKHTIDTAKIENTSTYATGENKKYW